MRNSRIRKIVLFLGLFFPNRLKLYLYRKLLGWRIGKHVSIGLSWIDAEQAVLGDHVRIGHFNLIRNLRRLEMADSSYMLNLNAVTAGQYGGWPCRLKIGERAGVMSSHFFDASGGIEIGNEVVIAGRSSQIWSHEKQGGLGQLIVKPVTIESGTYVAASVLIAPGVSIGTNSVVALGCVVKRDSYPDHAILVGNPTQVKKKKTMELQQAGIPG